MGYYTSFYLQTDDGQEDSHQEGIARQIGFDPFGESCKWYEYEEDMARYSVDFPTVTFILDGDGEESGDIWRYWFKNGHVRTWKLELARPINPPTPF